MDFGGCIWRGHIHPVDGRLFQWLWCHVSHHGGEMISDGLEDHLSCPPGWTGPCRFLNETDREAEPSTC